MTERCIVKENQSRQRIKKKKSNKNKGKGTFRNYVQDFLDNRQDRDYNINEE